MPTISYSALCGHDGLFLGSGQYVKNYKFSSKLFGLLITKYLTSITLSLMMFGLIIAKLPVSTPGIIC